MGDGKAKTDYKPADFLSVPSGKPCPDCGRREGDKQFFGSCRVCAALVFNEAGRSCNKREMEPPARRFSLRGDDELGDNGGGRRG